MDYNLPSMANESPLFFIGDIHGYLDKLIRHLRYAGLATSNAQWTGDNAELWFTGDFTDRGPDGAGVVDYVMRLQQDAAAKGGRIGAVVGNHDVGILAAKLFPNARSSGPTGTFYGDWVEYGGTVEDLPKLEPHHIEWLRNLPAMALAQNRLLLHADSMYYLHYGDTMDKVNAATKELLNSTTPPRWDELLSYAGERGMFDERQVGGVMRASQLLAMFGGKQIVHGHTGIYMLSGEPIDRITRAYTYCQGLAVDVDGTLYKGGTGFVYEAPPLDKELAVRDSMHARW